MTTYHERSGATRTVISLGATSSTSKGGAQPEGLGGSAPAGADTGCTLSQASPTTTSCPPTAQGDQVTVGWNGTKATRAVIKFDMSQVPRDLDGQAFIANIDFNNDDNHDLSLYRATKAWAPASVSWNNAATATPWAAAGGDYDTTTAAYNAPGMQSNYGQFDVTQLLRDWISGATPNDGVLLKETTENDNVSITDTPYLNIVSYPRSGDQPTDDVQTRNITDRVSAGLDPVTGNVSVEGTAFSVAGVGQNLNLGFNIQTNDGTPAFTFGDLFLDDPLTSADPTVGSFIYIAPDGAAYAFLQTATGWITPPGLNATVTATTIPADGDSALSIRFNDTGITNVYDVDDENTGQFLSSTDPNGNTITYNFVDGGNVTSVTDTQGRSYTIAYNADNNPSTITDVASGRTATFTYTTPGDIVPWEQLSKFTDATGKSVSFGFDSQGRLNKITDPDGNTTTMVQQWTNDQDIEAQATSITYGANGSTPSTYQYAYPAATSAPAGTTTITDPNGGHTTIAYDATDRVTQVTDPLGHTESTSWSPSNEPSARTNGLSAVTSYSYDTLNNLTAITSPSGTGSALSVSLSYPTSTGALSDFLPTTSTDAGGNNTTYSYNSSFELSAAASPAGAGGTPTNHYQGDTGISCTDAKPGELCSTVDGNGNTTSYTYDTHGNVASVIAPSPLGATTMTYDADGRMITRTDGRGTKTYTTYDADDRIAHVSSNASSCPNATCIAYTYNGEGSITKRVDPSGTTTYTYDAQQRPLTKNTPTGNTSMTYDGNGNLATYTDAGGTTTYRYDAANRNTALAEPGGSCPTTPAFPNTTKCTSFGYDNANDRTSTSFPNGQTTTLVFDATGREQSVTAKSQAGTTIVARSYSYQVGTANTDLRQSVTDQTGSATSYTYDPLNRLTSATTSTNTQSWTYDADGNRTSSTTGGVTTDAKYTAADELCYTASSSTAACGSAPTGATTYTYNGTGDLTATSGGAVSAATYSTFDQTASTTTSGTTTADTSSDIDSTERTKNGTNTFINGVLGVTRESINGTAVEYIRDPNGNLIGAQEGGNSYYYTLDATGSVILLTDHTGATAATYTYDAWGNTTSSSGTMAATNPMRYGTGITDSNGLIKLGTRYYNPGTGTFTQTDPVQSAGSGYAFAGDDPINAGDPTGRDASDDWTTYEDVVIYGLGVLDPGPGDLVAAGYTAEPYVVDGLDWTQDNVVDPLGEDFCEGVGSTVGSWGVPWEC